MDFLGAMERSAGSLEPTGCQPFTGGTTISSGTLASGASGLSLGQVNVASGATLAVNGGNIGLSALYFPMTAAQAANYDGNASLQRRAPKSIIFRRWIVVASGEIAQHDGFQPKLCTMLQLTDGIGDVGLGYYSNAY